MDRNEIIEALANYYDIELETDDNGEYIIDGEDAWESGCCYSRDGKWLNLKTIVKILS
jgi:hypothetical protein